MLTLVFIGKKLYLPRLGSFSFSIIPKIKQVSIIIEERSTKESLFKSNYNSDESESVTLKVNSSHFKLHRAIIQSRLIPASNVA